MAKQKVTDQQVIDEHKKRLTQEVNAGNLGISRLCFSIRMRKLGLKPWYREHVPEEIRNRHLRVFYAISGNPGNYKDVMQRAGIRDYSLFRSSIRSLKDQKKVLSFDMYLVGHTGDNRFRSHESVDGIAGDAIYYAPGDETLLGSYITGHLPRELTRYFKVSLVQRLSHLPEKALEVVRDYLDRHMVK